MGGKVKEQLSLALGFLVPAFKQKAAAAAVCMKEMEGGQPWPIVVSTGLHDRHGDRTVRLAPLRACTVQYLQVLSIVVFTGLLSAAVLAGAVVLVKATLEVELCRLKQFDRLPVFCSPTGRDGQRHTVLRLAKGLLLSTLRRMGPTNQLTLIDLEIFPSPFLPLTLLTFSSQLNLEGQLLILQGCSLSPPQLPSCCD